METYFISLVNRSLAGERLVPEFTMSQTSDCILLLTAVVGNSAPDKDHSAPGQQPTTAHSNETSLSKEPAASEPVPATHTDDHTTVISSTTGAHHMLMAYLIVFKIDCLATDGKDRSSDW